MSEQPPQHASSNAQWDGGQQLQPHDGYGMYPASQVAPRQEPSAPEATQNQYYGGQYPPEGQPSVNFAAGHPGGGYAGDAYPPNAHPGGQPGMVPVPAAPYGYEPSTGLPYSEKSKVTAGVLQIVLGGLGVGRFYKGDVGIGIAQIVVTLITFGIGGLWPLIDGILMLTGRPTDKQGRPLRG